MAVTMERVVDKLRELEARVRALERHAEDSRTLDDIRCSISMLTDTISQGTAPKRPAVSLKHEQRQDQHCQQNATALADPRFRTV
jgi:hypothetical protein